MLFQNFEPLQLLGSLLGMLLGITLHEFSHAWVADWLGDPTPRSQGRVTINPLKHLDPIGSLLILIGGFGWGRAVEVQPRYFKKSVSQFGGMALVALAGPVANVIIAIVFSLIFRGSLFAYQTTQLPFETIVTGALQVLYTIVTLNLMLALFNLLPIPPLDGSKILLGVLPPQLAVPYAGLQRYGYGLLMILFVLGNFTQFSLFEIVLRPPMMFFIHLLTGV